MVFDQWVQRRQAFQLVWSLGLVWYGVSAGCEFLGSAFGWNEALYKTWYLIGALFVAAYLGAGTIYLLSKTRFGYFVGVTFVIGGALSLAATAKYPGSATVGTVTFVAALLGAIAVIAATAVRRRLAAHIAMGVLLVGAVAGAYLILSAALPAPGWAVDPNTHVPVGSAFPGYVRVLTPAFNVAGALCLVFGAIFSAYVYMPKRKVLRAKIKTPVLAQLYGAAAVPERNGIAVDIPYVSLFVVPKPVPLRDGRSAGVVSHQSLGQVAMPVREVVLEDRCSHVDVVGGIEKVHLSVQQRWATDV